MSRDEIISSLNDINAGLVTEIDQLKRERDEAWHAARQIISAYRESEDPENFEWWLEEEAYPLWPQLKEEPAG